MRKQLAVGITDRLAMGMTIQRSAAHRTAERLVDAMERQPDRPALLLVIADHPDAVQIVACKVLESVRRIDWSVAGGGAGRPQRQRMGVEWMPDAAAPNRWTDMARRVTDGSVPMAIRVVGVIRGASNLFDELLQTERSHPLDDGMRERRALAAVRAAHAAIPEALALFADAAAVHLAWPWPHRTLLAAGDGYDAAIRELAAYAIQCCADPRTGQLPERWGSEEQRAVLSACAGDRDAYRNWLVEQVAGAGDLPVSAAVTWLAQEADVAGGVGTAPAAPGAARAMIPVL